MEEKLLLISLELEMMLLQFQIGHDIRSVSLVHFRCNILWGFLSLTCRVSKRYYLK